MDVEVERELVRQAALDYFEGWYDAEVVRMDQALHNELTKHSFVNDGGERWPTVEQGADGRVLHPSGTVTRVHSGLGENNLGHLDSRRSRLQGGGVADSDGRPTDHGHKA